MKSLNKDASTQHYLYVMRAKVLKSNFWGSMSLAFCILVGRKKPIDKKARLVQGENRSFGF